METQTIISLIAALTEATVALAPEVEKMVAVMKSQDRGEIQSALASLQAAGDALHGRVHDKLARVAGGS